VHLVPLPCSRGLSGQVRRRGRTGSCSTALLRGAIGAEEPEAGLGRNRAFPRAHGVSLPGHRWRGCTPQKGWSKPRRFLALVRGRVPGRRGRGVQEVEGEGRDSGTAAKCRGRGVPLVRVWVDRGEAFCERELPYPTRPVTRLPQDEPRLERFQGARPPRPDGTRHDERRRQG